MGIILETSVFEQLQEFKWRSISFPVSEFSTSIGQDHVEHKWVNRDGAHIEATGRAPIVTHARCLFRNGIAPGASESWGVLYPDGFRQFIAACLDRTSGTLQHPEFGNITCKFSRLDAVWTAEKRDGVDVSVTWTETQDQGVSFDEILSRPSPVTQVVLNALDLDAQIISINRPELAEPDETMSFTDAARLLTSLVDQTSLISKQISGQIDHLDYRLTRLGDAISAMREPTFWPAVTSITRMQVALRDVRLQALAKNVDISFYIVPADQTLAMLAAYLENAISDLLKLNPQAAAPVIKKGSPIRYYRKAA